MSNHTNPSGPALASTAAQAALAEAAELGPPPSAEALPAIRAETRAHYAPVAERALAATNVATEEIDIGGVRCLQVTPSVRRVEWPILYGFGGGFITGSPFEDLIIAAPLSVQTGARIIIPDYRLAPEHPWPASVDDGFAVYQALSEAPFALVGESAGGNLAMTCILRAQAAGLRMPGVMALLSPWCDLAHGGGSLTANDGRDPTLNLAWVKAAATLYTGLAKAENPEISPINGQFGNDLPPVLITTGTRDLLQSQAIRAEHVLRAAGAETRITIWDNLWHVFEFDDRLPEAAESIRQIAEFVTLHMSEKRVE